MTRMSEAAVMEVLRRKGYRIAEQFGAEVVDTDAPDLALQPLARNPDGTLSPEAARHEPPADPRIAPQMSLLELRELAFRLPQPISVNDLYRVNLHTGAKYLTDAQKQFRSQVISIVRSEMRKAEMRDQPLLGRLEARVVVSDRLDIDNGLKSLLDGLQHAKAYRNDSQIRRLVVEVVPMPRDREYCDVRLREIAA